MATRVLIADSSELLLNSYRRFLARDGFDVATVGNGLECIAQLRTFLPDVVVIDLDLPWGGALGVLAMMHEEVELPLVPVIVLTARLDPEILDILFRFEMTSDFSVKPLGPEQLARRILRLVDDPPPLLEHDGSAARARYRAQGNRVKPAGDAAPLLCEQPRSGVTR